MVFSQNLNEIFLLELDLCKKLFSSEANTAEIIELLTPKLEGVQRSFIFRAIVESSFEKKTWKEFIKSRLPLISALADSEESQLSFLFELQKYLRKINQTDGN
jgi:hypothetical protein